MRWIVLIGILAASAVGAIASTGNAATAAAPAASGEPQLTGDVIVGSTLTASNGTWSNNPASFAYQWVRCPVSGGASDGSDCAAVAGATASSYTLTAADGGFRMRVRVTATNADGSATVASNATATVPASTGITSTAAPAITGSATVGSTLTASAGTFTGDGLTYSYSWLRCPGSGACTAIAGATSVSYVVQQADAGATLRFVVVVASGTSRLMVMSAPTAVVTAGTTPPPPAPSPANGCPAGTGVVQVAELSPPARLAISRFVVTPRPITRGVGAIGVQVTVTACGGRPVQGALVFATPVPYQQFRAAERPSDANGVATLPMQRAGRFPASPAQRLLAVFVRARKPGEDALAGVSTRRLVSFPIRVNG